MRSILTALLTIALLTGCGADVNSPDRDPDPTELWIVDGVTYTSEPAAYDALHRADPENWLGGQTGAREEFNENSCQHWTFDRGTWWVRNCGYTLSEQCMYFSGPTGELRSCDEVGGGPGGNW